jgi:NADH:ubiquinone oxidoreductase subunit 6 (subunit J)
MRKRYRVLVFAALVAALVVPVGYALSIETKPKTTHATRYKPVPTSHVTVVAAPVMIPRAGEATSETTLSPVSDAAKLLCIGTVLFGLAAAVRKAV